MKLSVILCTHNPNLEPLRETLEGLRRQGLSQDQWELILVDNASEPPLKAEDFLGSLPNGRMVAETKPGLTPARLRGLKESVGRLMVYVDDDNVLAPDYLKVALEIFESRPYIGAFGGSIEPVFKENPPEWTRPYLYLLAIRSTPKDRWGLVPGNPEIEPCGAGLCVRREVAEFYRDLVQTDPLRASLDRRGESLASAGDTDLILCSYDLGLGVGRFSALTLKHLIPKDRLQADYLLRLFEAMVFSGTILNKIRGYSEADIHLTAVGQLRRWKRFVFGSPFDRKMSLAEIRGRKRALLHWSKAR